MGVAIGIGWRTVMSRNRRAKRHADPGRMLA